MVGDNVDMYGRRHRSDGDHAVGDSMPGTVGDSEGTLHDKDGRTPVWDESVEVPSDHVEESPTEERTETNGKSVEELLVKE